MAVPGLLVARPQVKFLLAGKITADVTATYDFTNAQAYGAAGTTNYAWPVSNYPDFDPGQEEYSTPQLSGKAQATFGNGGWENTIMRRAPTTTYEWDGTAYNLAVPLRGLFQRGCAETAGTPHKKTYTVPVGLDTAGEGMYPEFLLYLAHYMNSGSNFGIEAAVTKSITLSCDNNGPLKVSANFLGRRFLTDSTIQTPGQTIHNGSPLLWRHAVTTLDDASGNNQAMPSIGFSLTIEGNWTPCFGNSSVSPYRFMCGSFNISGSLKFPYEASTYQSGSQPWKDFMANGVGTAAYLKPSRSLQIYWGSATGVTAGDFAISAEVLFGKPVSSAESEAVTELPFTAYSTGSVAQSLSFILADGVDTV